MLFALNFHPPGPSHPFEGRGGGNFIPITALFEIGAARTVPDCSLRKSGTFLQAEIEPGSSGVSVAFRVRDVNPKG